MTRKETMLGSLKTWLMYRNRIERSAIPARASMKSIMLPPCLPGAGAGQMPGRCHRVMSISRVIVRAVSPYAIVAFIPDDSFRTIRIRMMSTKTRIHKTGVPQA